MCSTLTSYSRVLFFHEKMALMSNKMPWHTAVFLIGLFTSMNTVSCSGRGERQFRSQVLLHSLVVQNTTTVDEPKHFDANKTPFQPNYDYVAGIVDVKQPYTCFQFVE